MRIASAVLIPMQVLPAAPCQVGPNPFRNKIVQLMIKKTNEITNASASPTKTRYIFDWLLPLQTIGIVTNGVKNIANHNISPILSSNLI
jgi:hypothetical protein